MKYYVECCVLMPLNFFVWPLLVLVLAIQEGFLQYVIQCGDCISIHNTLCIFKDENKKQNKLVLQAKKRSKF